MDDRIRQYIDEHREEMIGTMVELIRTPSADGGETKAQEIVRRKLEETGFLIETFRMDERVKDCPDYCEPGMVYHPEAYNLAGTKKGRKQGRSLLLFGHIDTESEDHFGTFDDPYRAEVTEDKIVGLGAADDKGGIAMMLEALKAAQTIAGEPDYDITVLSILGKHGGAFGTLSAMRKGYTGGNAIYLHPAETGHGFQEIKNISLGILDMKLTVYGKPGIPHDDLSAGENANLRMAEAVSILEDFNQAKRKERLFDFGSFKGQPSYLLNIGTISSEGTYGTICEKAECLFRCRFFFPLTTEDVFTELKECLEENLEGDWVLEKALTRAEPAMVDNDDPFVRFIERSITKVEGEKEFIHQYHGGSDIRFPILYGKSRCVGIGPYCELPVKGSGTREWIDIEDYLRGVAILTT
ncbi:MAG: M20/M25/M40 family metallo-hydrolase, partial [Erysipelotrichaceae bacterium]|nr:M20/M25/M40 family metallo-hydrolase [Erysipelotrichaceae bacterium]